MSLKVVLTSSTAQLPKRATSGSAGYDLYSAVEMLIDANSRGKVPLNIKVMIPEGTYGRIAPRSGLAFKSGIDVGAGVIDSDYRDEVGVILFNHGDREFHINIGDRIAQLILVKIETPDVEQVESLDETERTGGFGSTGV